LELLKIYLKQTRGIDWDTAVKPKVVKLVIQTLLSVQGAIVSQKECFELYGFDILIDSKAEPWLLEVNLSPACAERSNWLTSMLKEMALGMLGLVTDIGPFPKNQW